MRDSALKLPKLRRPEPQRIRRRRAHARQRFETRRSRLLAKLLLRHVGEELMRDSALKLVTGNCTGEKSDLSEKSSCATAL